MKVTSYEIKTAAWKRETPLRIVHLSDLHNKNTKGILSAVRSFAPEIIVITGDYFEGSVERSPRSHALLSKLVSVAPVYFSLGNHEYDVTELEKHAIRRLGVHLLDNSFEDTRDFRIGGLTSAYLQEKGMRSSIFRTTPPPKPGLEWMSSFEDTDSFKLLLCHHPEYYAQYLRERNFDLVLSGHAHGGQIELFGQGIVAPGQGLFPKYTGGVHENRLVISRGLANTFPLVPRLGNEREIITLTVGNP